MIITLNYVPEEKADQPKIKAESDTKEKADKIKKVCRIEMRQANNYCLPN